MVREMDERRERARHEVWFPVRVDSEKIGEHVAVTRDVSSGGVLLSTRSAPEEGARVIVSFKVLPEDEVEHQVVAHIVRVEPNPEDPDGLWPLRIALAFETPVPELESQLSAAEAKRREGG